MRVLKAFPHRLQPGFLVLFVALGVLALVAAPVISQEGWREVRLKSSEAIKPHKRHEHAFVEVGGKLYALGGRRIQPVDIYDPISQEWAYGRKPPLELHHFQALAFKNKVLVAGAFTGKFPEETPVECIYFYDVLSDSWSEGPRIPEDRRRGSAGAFLKEGKLYLVCGLTDGHRSGWVAWFDEYDFETKKWRKLPDAPRARDHFHAVLVGEQLVLAGGRRSGFGGEVFRDVIAEVDVFDFSRGVWKTLPSPQGDLPTPRAGASSLVINEQVFVIGGETARKEAHVELEALDLASETWRSFLSLPGGRHASQPAVWERTLYLQAGSIKRGGKETRSLIACPFDALAEPVEK